MEGKMENMSAKLSKLFSKYAEEFKELNEYLYNNPELGLQEFKACAAHTEMLKNTDLQLKQTLQGFLLLLWENTTLVNLDQK